MMKHLPTLGIDDAIQAIRETQECICENYDGETSKGVSDSY